MTFHVNADSKLTPPSKHFTLTPAKTTKPKTRRIIGIDADDPRLPPEWKRRIRKWTSEPVTHRFKDVEEFSRYFRSRSNKRHPSTRKRKLKDPQKPEPTFDEVLDRALSQTARTLKRWWHRKR
jgi:hypothetical protein